MDCPYCASDSRVIDSRGARDVVRRRRECMTCRRRFTTYERLAPPEIRVLKAGGETEPFDRQKLFRVVTRVARDRGVSAKRCDDLVRGLEAELIDAGVQTVASAQIADHLLVRLRALDKIAAERFAINYAREDGSIHTARDGRTLQLDLPLPTVDEELAEPAPAPRRRSRKAGTDS